MRILFVLGGFRVGGYEILSVRLANCLADRGNKVAILSLSGDKKILEKVNRSVTTYGIARKHKYDFALLTDTLRVLGYFNPDIVMSCAFFEYFIVRLAACIYRGKAKFLLSFHTTEPFDTKEKHWNKLYGAMARFFNDHYVAIHSSQKFFYSREYRLPVGRFTLIHNGVDTDYFRPVNRYMDRKGNILRIVHVANLKPLKDQWTLLKAVADLDKRRGRWQLTVVGEDQSDVLRRYRDFVERNNIAHKVFFVGMVSDIRKILNDADVFVLTSMTEALPLSVIEAIAMGVPCIVTDVGGNSDIIEDGKQGFLVKPRDHEAVSQYLMCLADNHIQRKRMGLAARAKALAKFDFNIMVDKYTRLIESITCS